MYFHGANNTLPVLQIVPVYHTTHIRVTPFTPSVQEPPFAHRYAIMLVDIVKVK
jgi:hypothetical protein